MRLKQAGIIGAGLVLAAVMVLLGLWQMGAYRQSGLQVAIDRTLMEPVSLADSVRPDGTVEDIYARRASFEGRFRPELQVLVGREWPLRVVTAFELTDGRLVAVVRGTAASGSVPEAPAGHRAVTGVFLASDPIAPAPSAGVPDGTLGSVRLPRIAQDWPGRLIAGYVTLSEADARAQGLEAAVPPLPEVKGSPQNSGYALQWWVFAVIAVVLSVLGARNLGAKARAAEASKRSASDSGGGS
ncbi:MAG: SURF1 family protein [Propionibacteriaceae bacterium]|nr:SURF1 family protein [Propionibacteriaceae bacterium]